MTIAPQLTAVEVALERGTERLLALQHPNGYWVGELESNATMIAEHLFLLHVLGLRDRITDLKLGVELLHRRRDDATWAIWWDGPPDLSVTVEAYVALQMIGIDLPDDRTEAYIRAAGGIPSTRIFTRAFMALLGQWPWHRMATVPVELVLAPPSAPLSIYDFACWARQTLVPLSVVQALRPVRPVGLDLRSIGARPGVRRPALLRTPLRNRAIATAERW
ncbi:MAG: squalene--hopene cyclase, partial [Gaiellaceae bacterium]